MSSTFKQRCEDVQPNGDIFVSEYGNGWQNSFVITKDQLDAWDRTAGTAALSPQPRTSKHKADDAKSESNNGL